VNYYRLKSVASVGVCRLMRPYPTKVVTTPCYRYLSVYLDRLTATFTFCYFAFVIYISRLSFIITHLGQRDTLFFIFKNFFKNVKRLYPRFKKQDFSRLFFYKGWPLFYLYSIFQSSKLIISTSSIPNLSFKYSFMSSRKFTSSHPLYILSGAGI